MLALSGAALQAPAKKESLDSVEVAVLREGGRVHLVSMSIHARNVVVVCSL